MSVCGEPGCPQLVERGMCAKHAAPIERARIARRGDRYGPEHRRAARESIEAEPWCHWPGCGRIDDLTADHYQGGYRVLCRSHNTEAANRARARIDVRTTAEGFEDAPASQSQLHRGPVH